MEPNIMKEKLLSLCLIAPALIHTQAAAHHEDNLAEHAGYETSLIAFSIIIAASIFVVTRKRRTNVE